MMEGMNAKVMENEKLEDITGVEGAKESDSIGALVAGVVGGLLAYAMIDGIRRLWGFVGAKLAKRKTAKKIKAEVVNVEYTEAAAEDSNEEDSEK